MYGYTLYHPAIQTYPFTQPRHPPLASDHQAWPWALHFPGGTPLRHQVEIQRRSFWLPGRVQLAQLCFRVPTHTTLYAPSLGSRGRLITEHSTTREFTQRSGKTDISSRGIHPYFPRPYYLSIPRIVRRTCEYFGLPLSCFVPITTTPIPHKPSASQSMDYGFGIHACRVRTLTHPLSMYDANQPSLRDLLKCILNLVAMTYTDISSYNSL